MHKNWPYILLALLIAAWVGQMFLSTDTAEPPIEQEATVSNQSKASSKVSEQPPQTIKIKKEKTKQPPSVSPVQTETVAEAPTDKLIPTSVEPVEALRALRGGTYKKLSGYPAVVELLEQECGNLIDTDIERMVVDVSRLSGNDIFVSAGFCMKSAIWNRVRNIDAVFKPRTPAQLEALQNDYNKLVSELENNIERIIVTKLFVNQMSKHYDVFPTYEAFGNKRYVLAVLVESELKRGRIAYSRPQRFYLLNQLDIPQYLFKDTLEITLPEQEQAIISIYKEKVDSIFAEHIKLFEKENNAD